MSRQQVLNILRGTYASRVRFSFSHSGRTVTVNRTTFERVASAIENGRVNLDITGAMTTPGAGAEYNSGTNTLRVPPIHGRIQEAYLIHESVHASLDLTRSTGLTVPLDEAVCYIAEVIYYRRTGLARGRVNEALRNAANPIADSIVRTGTADTALITNLMTAISNHSVYSANASGCYLRNG